MPAEPRSLKEVFLAALAVAPEARAAWLGQVCGHDADLRRHVELMLAAHDAPQSLLDRWAPDPPSGPVATVPEPIRERPGMVIGPYKLLQQLGEGGMGTVFMAEQTEPVQRKVALKIIKPGMDSRQVITRFDAERQVLALMDHPNIARVLDAGTTEPMPECRVQSADCRSEISNLNPAISTGRPYFVMELVKGVPITRYCDEHRLTPKQRLELFLPVCQAVQHAHQKGIIHRDLKPSNVLVAEYDDKPVAKVIDFGVAKATGPKLTERTLFTEFGQVLGTLEYMSPEQAKLNALDIDTRSDLYALGVLLYELLTGTTPFKKERLHEAAFDEMLRIIREEEPPRPSTRLSTTEELAALAANRSLEPKKLTGLVRGDLDWIVMKCLEKDRGRRYETANGLARDIERYLHDEPVYACPPSAGYRLRKFARRHKASLTTAALLLAALLLGSGLSIWQAIRATLARDAEVEAQLDLAAAKQLADDRAEQIGQDLKRLNEANELVDSGRFYLDLGQWARAESAFTKAVQCRPDHSRVWAERAELYLRLGFWDLGAADYARAFQIQEPGSAHYFFVHALLRLYVGDTHGYRQICERAEQRFAGTTEPMVSNYLNGFYRLSADPVVDPARIVQLAQAALPLGRAPWLPEGLGLAHYRAGEYEEAIARLREARAMDPNWEKARTNAILAMAHHGLGEAESARQSLDAATRANDQRIQSIFQNPPGNLGVWWANVLYADLIYREAKKLIEGSEPTDDARLWVIRGRALRVLGRDQQAVTDLSRAIDLDSTLAPAWINRAHASRRLGDWGKARADYRKAIDLDAKTGVAQNELAWLLATCPEAKFRDPAAAVAWAKKAVDLDRTKAIYRNTLGVAQYRARAWPAAVTALMKSVELSQGGDSIDYFFLAMAHWRLDQKETARRWFAQALYRTENLAPANDELRRFRAEAAALLNLPEDAETISERVARDDLELCTLVLETDAGALWAYHRRATALLQREQWGQAAADLVKIVELNPNDHYRWFLYAQTLLLADETDGYRKLCTKMQKRFGQTKARQEAGWLINVCAMGPEAMADFMPILTLAEWEVANHPIHWHSLVRLGGAYYRAGRFEAAIEQLQKADQVHKNGGNASSWFFMAMAYHRLGQADQAREWLTKAAQWMDQAAESNMADPYCVTPLTLRYRLGLLVQRREAERLVKGPADAPTPAGTKAALAAK
jgi:serine/threonine protein kinase/tetratricopeptide (TPR) repeat protein